MVKEDGKRTFIPYDPETLESGVPQPLKGEMGTIRKYTTNFFPKNVAEKLAREGMTVIAIRETGHRLANGKIPVKIFDGSVEEIDVPVEKAPIWAKGLAVKGIVKMKKGKAMYNKTIYLKKGTPLLGEDGEE